MPRPRPSPTALLLRRVYGRQLVFRPISSPCIRPYAEQRVFKPRQWSTRTKSLRNRTAQENNPTICSGCGITLQDKDNTKPGFIYRRSGSNEPSRLWRERDAAHAVFDQVLKEVDESTLAKLLNVDPKVQESTLQQAGNGVQGDFEQDNELAPSMKVTSVNLDSTSSRDIQSKERNICQRCHEITYHSNPLPHTSKYFPPPKTMSAILDDISTANPDPTNPPLLVPVLDVADFPLCFVPFQPPPNSKVLFVVNRADSVCETANAMGHIRAYFQQNLPKMLEESGMDINTLEVHPISAKKGYGIKKLLDRILQLRNAESNVYFIGRTNVGKSSVIGALIEAGGFLNKTKTKQQSKHKNVTPTVSVFPHTTLGNVEIPLSTFRRQQTLPTKSSLFDTPGIEGDNAFLNGFIDPEYSRAVSLLNVGGFQRVPTSMTAGRSMVLGGLFRIDLLECEAYPGTSNAHIRITPYTNLTIHVTSHEKAEAIFNEDPSIFFSRKSQVEVVTKHAMGPQMKVALELNIKSTGNSERNTIEIVFAGFGFVAIGGNFPQAKLRVWTPDGRGVGIRKPIVQMMWKGYSLDPVKKKFGRLIMLGAKSNRVPAPAYYNEA